MDWKARCSCVKPMLAKAIVRPPGKRDGGRARISGPVGKPTLRTLISLRSSSVASTLPLPRDPSRSDGRVGSLPASARLGRPLGLAAICWLSLACHATVPAGEPSRPLRPDSLENNGWDRDCDLLSIDLDVAIDVEAGTIEGRVSHHVRGLACEAERLRFHAVDLGIDSIRDSAGRSLTWTQQEPELVVELARPLLPGAEETIAIEYSGEPEAGLYFVETSKDAPEPSPQAWTQGQPEDTRRWIPTWDFPNDRAKFRGRFRVGEGLIALSNGSLLETVEHENGDRSFQWELEENIPTYLIAVAIGQWEHYADDWNGLPVDYWVGPGTGEEKARRAFGETPEMLSYFSELLGVAYPYPKYGQVAVAEFVAGGMENASLTIQHDYVIASPEEHIENDGETRLLVAHELAHQWFGDLVTCFGWSHLWLNEAWASYLELLFERHKTGPENFALWLERYRAIYLRRGERTRRPLSEDWRTQVSPERCTHEYVKGPWVLHMLEREVGSEAFWLAVREYLERHSDDLVQTEDFARAIFDVTGRNVEGFLEQWVEAGGHPVYEVRLEYADGGRELVVFVEQTQRTSELVPLFDVTVEVEVHDGSGARREKLRIDDQSEEFRLPLIGDLVDFVFDAPCAVLCELDLSKEAHMWVAQSRHESAALRWRSLTALDRLRREGHLDSEEALRAIAASDPEVRLRRGAIALCNRVRDAAALLRLLETERDPLARIEILETLTPRRLVKSQIDWLETLFADIDSDRVREALELLRERAAAGASG